jgi:ectoine hydroxylase-related dioxygenase (phytanoyl-CoA dioxygenase family)
VFVNVPKLSLSQLSAQPDWGMDAAMVKSAQVVAELAQRYFEHGYAILPETIHQTLIQRVLNDVERLLAEGHPFRLHRPGEGIMERSRCEHTLVSSRRYGLLDLQNISASAREIITYPPLSRFLRIVLDGIPVVMQSQYFHYSSEKPAHADLPYLHLDRPKVTATGWISLEDIDGDKGALFVVPNSHRMVQSYSFAPDNVMVSGEDIGDITRYGEFLEAECARLKLHRVYLTIPAGTIVVFHPLLIHGATAPSKQSITRMSIATHFSSVGVYDCDHRRSNGTSTLLQHNGVAYYAWEHPGHQENHYE